MSDPQRKKTILIVEDEPSVVTYLETLLQDNGYDTISAGDGVAAMEKTRDTHPDLVCLDINLPVKSGVGFYRALKTDPSLSNTPVVIVTAVTGLGGNPKDFERFISTRKHVPPPEGFIAKPIDRAEFLDTVARALGSKE
ncbi:response regulator [Candidatus Sumerlaeota bacterium]|nr:response regulator [Candidatus Sumerlaeota bacterium]